MELTELESFLRNRLRFKFSILGSVVYISISKEPQPLML